MALHEVSSGASIQLTIYKVLKGLEPCGYRVAGFFMLGMSGLW